MALLSPKEKLSLDEIKLSLKREGFKLNLEVQTCEDLLSVQELMDLLEPVVVVYRRLPDSSRPLRKAQS